MTRTRSDLPRMQKQSPTRAPLARAVAAAPEALEKPAQSKKPPQMMRQYDLIERVRRYNPNSNEALLNRAYVYAMKAHGEPVSYTHLRAHETRHDLVCRLLLEKK